jgi:peptidyl-prolyl cis-trans isomerase C
MRRVLSDPLAHFAVLGTAVFLLLGPSAADPDIDRTVVVDRGQIARLVTLHRMTAGEPPTPAELERLIDDFVREEVLFREAVRLDLHRDDEIVRRRLAQKLDAMLADVTALPSPDDAELEQFRQSGAMLNLPPLDQSRDDVERAWRRARANARAEAAYLDLLAQYDVVRD